MPNQLFVGRENEWRQLKRAFNSKEAELITVDGRRRVGKTFLIRTFFESQPCLFFQVVGIKNADLKTQLKAFVEEISRTFYAESTGTRLQTPKNWMEAFAILTDAINIFSKHKKIALFFDEFPWMATKKSKLLEAFDYYWNRFWSTNPRIKAIICGSAASWIIKHVIDDKGGLHNRTTLRLHISPFTLKETKAYLEKHGIKYNNRQVLELYICLGGIPYYLKLVEKRFSAIQNVNELCFKKKGTLFDEFDKLFSSLFDHSEYHEEIIRLIAQKREGLERSLLEKSLDYKGGRLTTRLKELEESGFIMSFTPWGKERATYYKIIDEYTLFYLHWIAPKSKGRLSKELTSRYWEQAAQTAGWKAWAGYAFEAVCYKHLSNIRHALTIPEGAAAGVWRYTPPPRSSAQGAQIDLLFDRPDGIIHLCEIKYCTLPYVITKPYSKELLQKSEIYKKITKTEKQTFISMITSEKLKSNMYSEEIVTSDMNLNDFFS